METEIWKTAIHNGIEYAGYEISSFGRVRSLDRIDGAGHRIKGRLMKQGNTGDGYKIVDLCKDCKVYSHRINRMVAEAFVLNEGNLPEVGHKDANRTNNHYLNLEWCTTRVNSLHRLLDNGTPFDHLGTHVQTNGTYQARIQIDGKRKYLGTHATREKAHEIYMAAFEIENAKEEAFYLALKKGE